MLKLILLSLIALCCAHVEDIYQDTEMVCTGMYAPDSSPATISLQFVTYGPPVLFSSIIYNVQDEPLIRGSGYEIRTCNTETISQGLCSVNNTGTFILPNTTAFPVLNKAISLNSTNATISPLQYNVTSTGFYCIAVLPQRLAIGGSEDYHAQITFVNSFGLMPAADYPKLAFYSAILVLLFLVAGIWLFESYKCWNELLALQHIIFGLLVFLVVEHAFIVGFYSNQNTTGYTNFPLLIIVSVLNAGRNSASFFLILIVSLGYGVVKPSLGPTMKKCILLALVHLVFGIMYMIGSTLSNDLSISSVLLFVLPLSLTMTIFYWWILTALEQTMKKLEQRKQQVKLSMYKSLWYILLACIGLLVVLLIVNTIYFANRSNSDWLPTHWQFKWFLMDGVLNLVYLFGLSGVLWLWRPTINNRRYGLDELAQEDIEIEPHELEDFVAPANNEQALIFTAPRESSDEEQVDWNKN